MSVLSLTPDVLGEIFSLVQASHHRVTKLPHHVTVSHVNRAWRSVALSSPALWADVQISQHSNVEALVEFVSRARDCELDVNIIPNPSRTPHRSISRGFTNARNILSPVITHVSRWRRLHINAEASVLTDIMSLITTLQFPNLQSFELINAKHGAVPHFGPFRFEPTIFAALRLHGATIHVLDRRCLEGLKTLEFSRISCYMIDQVSIDSLSVADAPAHEPVMVNLRRLEIVVDLPTFPINPSFRPSSLVSLKLGGFSGTSADSIPSLVNLFDAISSPNLKYLELYSIRSFAWTAFILSLQFSVVPKYPGLESLRLRSLELNGLDAGFIAAFPKMTHLKLVSVDPEPLVRLLTDHPSSWSRVGLKIESSRRD